MDTNDPADQNDHPTTPLPWLEDQHASAAAPATAAPAMAPAPAAGMAVTDGMKAGEAPTRPSFFRRHALGVGVAAGILAVVVVAGGTAWGVSAAVAARNTAVPAAMNSATHAGKGAAAGAHKHAKGAVGTLTAISGDTWTVQSAAGATITVTVGSSTSYGTPKKPATASSFAVGDRIAVVGARSGDSVTAMRIAHLGAAKHPGTGAGTTPTGTPTPAATA